MGNRLKVGNKEFNEDSVVTTNIKTIFWFLGIVSSIIVGLLVYFYLNLNSVIDQNQQIDIDRMNKMKQEVLLEVNEVSEDTEAIEDDVWEIKGDVKLLLDRTTGTVIVQPVTINSATPTFSPPELDSLPTNVDPNH